MSFILKRVLIILRFIYNICFSKSRIDKSYDNFELSLARENLNMHIHHTSTNYTNINYEDEWGHFIDLDDIYEKNNNNNNKPVIFTSFEFYVIPIYNYNNNNMTKQFVRRR